MLFLLQKLLQEDDHEHSGHHKVQTLGIKGNVRANNAAQGGGNDPIALVQQGNEEIEPASVHPFGNGGGAVDGEGFVAQAEDEVEPLPAQPLVLVQHGDAIKEVPRLDHQGHEKGRGGGKGGEKHLYYNKLQRSAEDDEGHEHGIPKREAGDVHINAVCKTQKTKPGKNGNGVGESGG